MDKPNVVTEDAFVQVFLQVYISTLKEKMELTFRMFDFKNKGKLIKEDVRMVMQYVPFQPDDDGTSEIAQSLSPKASAIGGSNQVEISQKTRK